MLKYLKLTLAAIMGTMEYRMDFFLEFISKFFPVVIQWFMWTAIFMNATETIIMNYTYKQMIIYTVLSIYTTAFVSVNVHWTISEEIKSGKLSKYLVLPVQYFWYKVFYFGGTKLVEGMLVAIGFIITIIYFWKIKYINPRMINILFFFVILLLALALQFLISYCFSCLAFWMGECGGVFIIIQVISMIVSGAIFPLDIFGNHVLAISKIFPFYYITYFSTNVIIGKISLPEILQGILVMSIWIILLLSITKLLWNKGLKKYIAAGG